MWRVAPGAWAIRNVKQAVGWFIGAGMLQIHDIVALGPSARWSLSATDVMIADTGPSKTPAYTRQVCAIVTSRIFSNAVCLLLIRLSTLPMSNEEANGCVEVMLPHGASSLVSDLLA